jgi:hypothetical protein
VVSRVLAGDTLLFEVLMRRHNGVSEDVVKTRLTRARHAIQQHLLERTGAATAQAFMFGQSHCDRVVTAVLARISQQGARRSVPTRQ